jgi:hypothetical protein
MCRTPTGVLPALNLCQVSTALSLGGFSLLQIELRNLFNEGCLGEHECEICHNHTDRGEILIIDDDKMYVAPQMILHYIKDHSYRPPKEFMDAVDKISVT